MFSFFDRLKFASQWSKVSSLVSESKYQAAYDITSNIIGLNKRGSKYINLLLMHTEICTRLKKYPEASDTLENFFDRLFELNLTMPNTVYLSAYAASCNEAISMNLGYENKYLKFLDTSNLDFNAVNKSYKRMFSYKLIENMQSLLRDEKISALYPE